MQTEWILGLGGGLLIGLGAAIYLLGNGRIMGASGILGGLIDGSDRSLERLGFLAGLIGMPLLLRPLISPATETHLTGNITIVIVAGLLVGLGTRIANGCTSGHGVCGISRLSFRGIAATLVYIAAGVVTVALLRHVWGLI
ncbi:YeeE/YedE family protein [Ruegeria profundi]|uniref:YeeE/YedE family protein n=1 Tax=Ruegeria profundi TaxID=1685378 RepID=UPI001CD5D1B1|nr:YeeE/YedE thiosulfate transporter family protein [Ruegeria profundi]MCA0927655.1 YeeE/YedE family protein [Ruegeria profundi]